MRSWQGLSTKCSPSLASLDVELSPSLILRASLLALAPLAWAAIGFSALPMPLRILLGALVALYLALLLRRHGGCWGGPVCNGLRWDGSGWWWRDRHGVSGPLQLRGATLWPFLLVLDFRAADGRSRPLVLMADSAAADDLRRLRIVLRHAEAFGLPM